MGRPLVASWQLIMSGLLAGVGLAVLGLGGALLAGAKTSPFSIIFSFAGFFCFLLILHYLANNPTVVKEYAGRVLSVVNRLRSKPEKHGFSRLESSIEQLHCVQLSRGTWGAAFGWSLFNWVTDVVCLGCACWAAGGHPSVSGLMVAYAAGKTVGTAIPLLPGGLGVVDVTLVPALTVAGMSASDALAAVLIYRLTSYVVVAVIGWIVIAVRYRHQIWDKNRDTTLPADI